jgi:hypothetical protein
VVHNPYAEARNLSDYVCGLSNMTDIDELCLQAVADGTLPHLALFAKSQDGIAEYSTNILS